MAEHEAAVPSGAAADIRNLLYAAMGIFVLTVVIGILNGMDLIEFDRNTLMAHIHAGTLGWITLSVLAVCFWLFPDENAGRGTSVAQTWISWLAIASVPVLVLALWSGLPWAEAIFSLPVLAAIVTSLGWLLVRARTVTLTTPRFAALAAVATLALGAAFGTLIIIQEATSTTVVDEASAVSGHVAAMAFSYLVLIGMAIAEWRLALSEVRVSRAGAVQVGSLFIGGLLLVIGAVTGVQALLMLNLIFQLVAVGLFVARMARPVLAVRWAEPSSGRFFAVAAIYVVTDIALLMILIVQLVSGAYGPLSQEFALLAIPTWLVFALDHAIFVGVMTNAIFGLLGEFAMARQTALGWRDHVVFWGMNVGLAGFVVGLAFESAIVKQVFSPVMGVSILLGLALYAIRLTQRSRAATALAAHA